jgi:tetratricopeptide (TPR) repeat protein
LNLVLEPLTPLDRSSLWRLHDAYFAQKGVAAWHDGEVPHYSTSNYQAAVSHVAHFVTVLASSPRARDSKDIWVIEVGSGHGAFALNFLRALDNHPDAATWAPRVRYLMTDYQPRGLDEVAALPFIRDHVAAGRIVPALFDLRDPTRLTLRSGGAAPRKVDLVIANYVTCVLPLKNLQKRGSRWFEQHVSIVAAVPPDAPPETPSERLERLIREATRTETLGHEIRLQFDWKSTRLQNLYADALHRQTVVAATRAFNDATIGYPHGFMSFVHAFAPHIQPHGYVLINDYGSVAAEEIEGHHERRPEFYGNSLANSVNFSIFDAFCEVAGWGLLRTRAPEEILHSALLRPHRAWGALESDSFHSNYVARRGCDDVLDFWAAAHRLADDRELDAALRFWSRLIRLEPQHIEHYYRAGEVAIEAGRYELARALLEQGHVLAQGDTRLDFDFQLGRALCLLGRNTDAMAHYRASLAIDPHPVTFTNLGILLEEEGDHAAAFRAYRDALVQTPGHPPALERLALLRDLTWRRTLESWEGPEVVDPLAETAPLEPGEAADGEIGEA